MAVAGALQSPISYFPAPLKAAESETRGPGALTCAVLGFFMFGFHPSGAVIGALMTGQIGSIWSSLLGGIKGAKAKAPPLEVFTPPMNPKDVVATPGVFLGDDKKRAEQSNTIFYSAIVPLREELHAKGVLLRADGEDILHRGLKDRTKGVFGAENANELVNMTLTHESAQHADLIPPSGDHGWQIKFKPGAPEKTNISVLVTPRKAKFPMQEILISDKADFKT